MTSTPASVASFLMAASRSLPNGSESYSKVNREIFHSWDRHEKWHFPIKVSKAENHKNCKCLSSRRWNQQLFVFLVSSMIFFKWAHKESCLRSVHTDLKEPWEHIGWLASDYKKAGVELPEIRIQILQTLEEKSKKEREIESRVNPGRYTSKSQEIIKWMVILEFY